MNGEARVRKRIFMRRIEPRRVGQVAEALERSIHLLRRAFEQPATAHREQRIADERDAVRIEDQREVIERVAGDLDDAPDMLANADLVAFRESRALP